MKRAEVLDAWFNGDARLAASHFMRDFLAIRGVKDEWSPHYTIT